VQKSAPDQGIVAEDDLEWSSSEEDEDEDESKEEEGEPEPVNSVRTAK